MDRVAIRGSGGGVCFHGRARRGIIIEGTLRGNCHFVFDVVTNRRRIILTGMASLVGLPIPRIPASVRRDYVWRALRTFYTERPSLIHFNHRFCSIPRIHWLRLAFSRRVAGGVLRRARRGVAGSMTRSVHGTAVLLAGARGRLSRKFW